MIFTFTVTAVSHPQTVLSSRSEGDSKLQQLRTRVQSLSGHDLEESVNQEVRQKVKGIEEQWTRVLHDAKQVLDQAEKQRAQEDQLKDYEAARDDTSAWLQDKEQRLVSVDSQSDPEETISTAQVCLIQNILMFNHQQSSCYCHFL